MKKIRVSQLFVLGMIGLCAGATAWGQQSNSASQGPDRDTVGPKGNRIHHLLSAPAEAQRRAQQAPVGFAVTATNLVYGSGPVMRNPTNYLIFWQPPGRAAFPAGYQAGVEKFFQNVGGTPFYNIVTQYNDSTHVPVPNATSLGAPSYTDTTTVAPSGCNGTASGAVGATPNCPLTDGDIQNEVTVAIAANPVWATPGINVEYFVFTPSDVGECSNLQKDLVTWNCFTINNPPGLGPNEAGVFCAYHSFFGGNTIYAYQPFASNGLCYPSNAIQSLGYPNGIAVDVVLGEVSHEMIESNTDPLLGAWQGTGGGSDEIGDKCNFIYGYLAPDGTDIVLNGNRFKIQEEFSNDVTACTKRYGAAPVTGIPGTLAFGEVQAGTSAQQGIAIQNNGGGDLNILNMRLGATGGDYSLVNGQPTAATLHASEGLTANVQFAPPFGAPFGSPTDTLVVDTDQTPCTPVNSSCATPDTTTFDNISGTVGVPPDALCHGVTVSTDNNLCSTASSPLTSVNNGSFDPDGEGVTVTQTPAGPYTLGATNVTLTVVDNSPDHATAYCPAVVTVQDHQNPSITCPAPQTLSCTSPSGAAATLTPVVFDNCPAVTSVCAPTSGHVFGPGTTPVTCTATDASGNHSSCATSVTVNDVAPTIASIVAFPNVLTPPNKKLDPVVITVKASDVCDAAPPVCSITGVTANVPINPSDYKITGPLTLSLKAGGNGGHTLTYVVGVQCVSSFAGAATTGQVSVSAPAH